MNSLRRDHRLADVPDSVEERRAEIERLTLRLRNPQSNVRVRAAERLVEFGPVAFAPLRNALHLAEADVQVVAAEGLGKLGDAEAVEPLLQLLETSQSPVRVAAADALGRLGEARAAPGLQGLLKDKDLLVRAAAATALGELGQEASIPPLMEAYQSCFVGSSARAQRYLGLAVVGAVVMLFALLFWGTFAVKAGGLMGLSNCIIQLTTHYFGARRRKSKVACAVTEALVKIAEANPRPELHRLVRDLRATAGDRLQQEKETREASLRAADRIEALTAALHDLPLPAVIPAANARTLPLPTNLPATSQPAETATVSVESRTA